MDEAWLKARRDELWDTYVLKVPGFVWPDEIQDRAYQAVEMLRLLHLAYDKAISEGQTDDAMLTASRARVVWQLLTLEFGDWLLDISGLNRRLAVAADWEGCERVALKTVLTIHERSGPHPHRPAIDPMPVLMPRWMVHRLAAGLDALDQGEVQDLLQPLIMRRHDDTWSWDQMRACALEHVANLRGQDLQAQVAQRRVAVAMNVAAETLRSWDRVPALRRGCAVALQAGRLKSLFDDDPDYAKHDGNSVDSEVLERFNAFRAEPLSVFGRRYFDRFGYRHNQGPTGGD